MPFTITKSVPSIKTYPSLLGVAKRCESENLEVTYTISSIVSLTNTYGVAEYTVSIPDADLQGTGTIEFAYTGGLPFEEAENFLKQSLSQ